MKAILYARTSNNGAKVNRQNTDSQVNKIQEYAVSNNIDIVEVFCEHISGAVKNKDRKVLQECFTFALNNEIDIILFCSLDRLGRNYFELMENINWLQENKVNAYFIAENITLLNENKVILPYTTMYLSCLGVIAQQERENIKNRLQRGYEYARNVKRVKVGRKLGSKMTSTDREKKYKDVIKLLRKGMSVSDVLKICKQDNIKVGEATIWKLKKEFC
ncbi:MAG: recombinase family protein [Bacteroidales bacterium]|nr:recombinase family protein [Bacteroidales bacterium]